MTTVNSASSGNSTGSNAAYKTNKRVTGMFSSLDTDALVKSMTSSQQARIDAVKQKQTKQEWYTDALTSLKSDIDEFMSSYMSATGENSMLKSSTYTTFKSVTSSTSNAAEITASSSAEMGNVTIQINKLAKNASVTSSSKISRSGTEISSSNTATLGSLSLATPLQFDSAGNISFAINGKTFNFSKDTTLQNMINTINNDETANVTMKYSRLSDAFTITADSGGVNSKVQITNLQGNAFGTNGAFGIGDVSATAMGVSVSSKSVSKNGAGLSDEVALADLTLATGLSFDSGNKISFSINGKAFSFAKTTLLKDMIKTVNNDADAKVTMAYNAASDGFTIMSDSSADSVTVKNISGNAFGKNSAFGITETSVGMGTSSEAVINGSTVTRDSNEYTVDGITYELKKVTQGTTEPQVTFSLERDYSSTVSAVTKFIDNYNKLFTKLKNLVNEDDQSTKYPPLTDAQKAEMSTEEITAWEKKAKVGLLHQNKDVLALMSNLKNAFYSAVGGTAKNATEIGITTAGYFDSNAGQLEVDETKLSEALKLNPDEVIKMFTNGSSTAASSQQGIMYRLKVSMTKYTSTVTDSVKTVKKKISGYDTEISNMEDKLEKLADRYYAKFSKMETALSKLNSQSSYISQLFQ